MEIKRGFLHSFPLPFPIHIIIAGIGAIALAVRCNLVFAQQITPDGTLPSTVTSPDNLNYKIDNGLRSSNNLFHSFSSFSVPTGGEAYFNNAPDIANIISRITGNSISNIDGSLRANGSASLFLINPNGIVFGPNARLNIGGSFLASTANAVVFADGTSFRAKGSNTAPLLTVSTPVGLQYNTAAAIDVQKATLAVQPGRTLALVGGNVTLEGSRLIAPGGQIELGSVAPNSSVNLLPTNRNWALGYEGVENFQDIQLSGQAFVNATAAGGGDIRLQGRRVTLRDGSQIITGTNGAGAGGTSMVNATELVEVFGFSAPGQPGSSLQSDTRGSGSGGNLSIATRRLLVRDGGRITTNAFGSGAASSLTVSASESVEVIGVAGDPSNTSVLASATFGSGAAGNLTIVTVRLILRDGALLTTSTFGSGVAGNVIVNANESVEVIGVIPNAQNPSVLGSGTLGSGNAGSIIISTKRAIVLDGGAISASTFADGAAGNVTVNASESVEARGTSPDGKTPSSLQSDALVSVLPTGLLFKAPDVVRGNAGDLRIATQRLIIGDRAELAVSNQGLGNGGELRVTADSIDLDGGRLIATTASGEGGNMSLQANSLQLRRNSLISATAGGSGNGGNLSIEANTLSTLENSDIIADAIRGRGGNIQISSRGIFRSFDSDITASSQLGISGQVIIDTPDIESSNGLVTLPTSAVNLEELVAIGCTPGGDRTASRFTVTGRGGLPPSPEGILASESALPDLRTTPISSANNLSNSAVSKPLSRRTPDAIVEATGWRVNNDGKIVLTADSPSVTLASFHSPQNRCHAR